MTPERALFDAVSDLPPVDRPGYLAKHCPDADLRRKVELLLAADGRGETTRPSSGDWEGAWGDFAWPELPGYEILGRLGHGGMGVVYKARQVGLKRVVAVKMIRPEVEASPEKVRRFRLEAEAVARLQHPNIVQIHDVGQHEGRPFLVLEFIEGGSLAERLGGKPWPARQSAELMATVARAIHAVHQHALVHRDLKPSNVLLKESTVPKVTDFGIAKLLDTPGQQTVTGHIMGTPHYMAPEQAAGRNDRIGPATDVYGLGATLYELLTGEPPFRGESHLAVLDQVLHREPAPPRRLNAAVPRELETICLKCLSKDPADRYARAADLADDLERHLRGEPVKARPLGPAGRFWRGVRRRPLVAALSLGLVLMAVVLGIMLFSLLAPRDPNKLRVAVKPWVGYSPFAVAKEMDLCDPVKLEWVWVKDHDDALRRFDKGEVDVVMGPVECHADARGREYGLKAILKCNDSLGADAVVAREPAKAWKDLKGKRIAYVQMDAPHFLFLALCERDGIVPQKYFKQVIQRSTVQEVVRLFNEGGCDAAVIYEPFLKDVTGKYHVVATSADARADRRPAIVDIVTIREEYLDKHPDKVKLLAEGWFKGVEKLQNREQQAVRIAREFLGGPAGRPVTEQDYLKMASRESMRYSGREDNLTFFRLEKGTSEFRWRLAEAQERLSGDGLLRETTDPKDGDGSSILFDPPGRDEAR